MNEFVKNNIADYKDLPELARQNIKSVLEDEIKWKTQLLNLYDEFDNREPDLQPQTYQQSGAYTPED
jgi:hypothetical protein